MENFTKLQDLVNGQIEFHETKATVWARKQDGRRADRHKELAQAFRELAAELGRLQQLESKVTPLVPIPTQLTLSLGDIEGLPDELVSELSISDGDRLDFAIQSVIGKGGGVLSLDKILIALWRQTKEVHKRANINSRLYRMSQRGSLFAVPGKKAVYANREISGEEASKLN